ncbi:MAG TPA: VOC family protein [Bryobacteraceae bacterium]|jgi:catechol 2,3-dioxygenase-like lactoylglutathione lyase family enzyme
MPAGRITRRELGALVGGIAAAGVARAVEQLIYLSHIKLRVSDLDRSVAFYYSLFGGLTLEMKGGSHFTPPDMRAVVMKFAPGVTYMILSAPDAKMPVGLEHIALDTAGLPMATRYHMPQPFYAEPYIRDPDGTWIEFSDSAGGDWSTVPNAARLPLPGNPRIQPPVFDSVAIRRIAIKVSDLERAAEFYRHFGSEIGSTDSKTKSFDFRGTTLELLASREAPGLAGFSVGVRSFEFRSVQRTLRKMGIKAHGNRESIVFHDHDGNAVKVFSMDVSI